MVCEAPRRRARRAPPPSAPADGWAVVRGRIQEARPAQAEDVRARLQRFNEQAIGALRVEHIQLVLVETRPEAGEQVLGGMLAYALCGWLHLDSLWLDPEARGHGLGTALLSAAEARGRLLACHSAAVDTFDWQALGFYRRNGYEVSNRMADFPTGHTRYLLQKRLTRSAPAPGKAPSGSGPITAARKRTRR
jgi:ribosomal protein S18 acetylase RimI-like enzyme